MKKFIVTTTVNEPTEATLQFCEKRDWNFIIIGDLKTPHRLYNELERQYLNVKYLNPEDQEYKYPELSKAIGWKTIQRRNIGFVEAYKLGAEVIATIDDDCSPYPTWGENVLVGKTVEVDIWNNTKVNCFDPFSATNNSDCWQRGYPLEYLRDKNSIEYQGKKLRKILVQNDFTDGDSDFDAILRLTRKPIIKFDNKEVFGSDQLIPFNSQNTFLSREVFPIYCVFKSIFRMDDIYAAYILQKYFPQSVIFGPASTYSKRNEQDLVTNLEHEIYGYRTTHKLVNDLENFEKYLPKETMEFYEVYKDSFK